MAIEKSLQAEAPEGENLTGEALEIEIVDPEMVTLDNGDVEITIIPGEDDEESEFDANLVEMLDDREQQILADDIIGLVESDVQSRKIGLRLM